MSLLQNCAFIWILIFSVLACWSYGQTRSSTLGANVQLFKDLMENYDANIKPEAHPGDQLTVSLSYQLSRIERLDEKSMILTMFGTMALAWNDVLLTWNATEYGGFDKIIVNGDELWLPEIILLNGVDSNVDMTLGQNARVAVLSSGAVWWTPAVKWETSCQVYLRYFPFDTQICELQFTSWTYNAYELNLTNGADKVDLSSVFPNGEWEILEAKVCRREDHYLGYIPIVTTGFQIELKRKPAYLVLNLVMPAIFMSCMSMLVYLLPVESGEKISLGITVQLSYTVLLLMMSDITPRSSDTIPILTIYILFSMSLTALSLLATVLIISLHHRLPNQPVPSWLRTVVLNGLAVLLCMKTSKVADNSDRWAESVKTRTNDGKEKGINGFAIPADSIEFLRELQAEHKEKANEEKIKSDWEFAARVIDRLFLCLYCVVILVTTIVVLAVMTGSSNGRPEHLWFG